MKLTTHNTKHIKATKLYVEKQKLNEKARMKQHTTQSKLKQQNYMQKNKN